MKSLKFIALGIMLFAAIPNHAQVSVNVNLSPPGWGPAVTTEEYYFLPDVNSYYDIRTRQFIYLNNGAWIRAGALPARYRTYNLNTGNVIVLHDYHGRTPYVNYSTHKVKYKGNNGNHYGNGKGNGNGNGKAKGNGKGKKGKH
jgi:hypothetical protein